jgi:hypothetical protein
MIQTTSISSSKENRKHHIYGQYFTPEERKMLAAIPENDLSSEINLLRVLLARSFALVPAGPASKIRHPLDLKFQYDLCTIFSRVTVVIAGLVALHRKTNMSKSPMFDLVMDFIREANEVQGVR